MPEFTDAHGIAIVYDVHAPTGTPRGVVQLLHGVGEHAGRYGALIEALVGARFVVYADDHRGHGRTGMTQWGDARRLGHLGPGGHRAAVAACWQLTELIRGEHPGLPLVLLGHSWGSFLAQKLVAAHPEAYDALVLSGSAFLTPSGLNAGDLNARWKGPGATGREWLSSDPAVGRAFLEDPLTTPAPLLKLFGVADSLRLYGRPPRTLGRDLPVLLLVGELDPVGGPPSVQRLAAAYRDRSGLKDVTVRQYPGARHEVFNEVCQAQVRADLLGWLDEWVPAAGTNGPGGSR